LGRPRPSTQFRVAREPANHELLDLTLRNLEETQMRDFRVRALVTILLFD
jgi:hypothetical protein